MTDAAELALADLARSGLTADDATRHGLYAVDAATAVLGAGYRSDPALVIPYYDLAGAPVLLDDGRPFVRLRYYEPEGVRAWRPRASAKYGQAVGSPTRAYFPRDIEWSQLPDDAPLLITEGEKKAIAATKLRWPCIGLGGVWNWLRNGELLPELAALRWRDRPVYIVFDSDVAAKPQVALAQARLIKELSTQRGADVRVVRIPPKDTGGTRALDDFIVEFGDSEFEALLQKALPMSRMDKAVLALNSQYAIITSRESVYDRKSGEFLSTKFLLKGSAASSLRVEKVELSARGVPVIKQAPVAPVWLTHRNAERYSRTVLEPEGPEIVETDDGVALNLWRPFVAERGDIGAFRRLYDQVMHTLPAEHRDFIWRLWCYKAQKPAEKPAICPVFLGAAGAGKGLLTEAIMQAFSPYAFHLNAKTIAGQFTQWLDEALICRIDDPDKMSMHKSKDFIKNLISELTGEKNQKFVAAKQVRSYATYMINCNEHGIVLIDQDDRRYFVVTCVGALHETSEGRRLIEDFIAWKEADSRRSYGPQLMHALLTYDLQGWRPPSTAPITQGKNVAQLVSLSPLQSLLNSINHADAPVILSWMDAAAAWLTSGMSSNNPIAQSYCRETLKNLALQSVRPFYSAQELATMFPQIVTGRGVPGQGMTPAQLVIQLVNGGVRFLPSYEPKGFLWGGVWTQFYIVSPRHAPEETLTQAEFEDYMRQCPPYGAYKNGGLQNGAS